MGDRNIPTIHIEPTTSPSPSPIPTRVRPNNTRHSSYSSTASSRSRRPHHQQQEFVPAGEPGSAGLGERWQFEEAEHEAERSGSDEEEEAETESIEEEPQEWDNLRDGSVSRRPAWRRPSPAWIYPFIVGATLSLGMGIAPKSELYINLACLVVGPQQPRSDNYGTTIALMQHEATAEPPVFAEPPIWTGGLDGDMTVNTTLPPKLPVYHPSPADEWFKKIQREMYDYELNHRMHINGSTPSKTPAPAYPSGPLPHPTDPEGGHGGEDSEPTSPEKTPGAPRQSPPYHEIDPRSCKRDPRVQAATAKLTMFISLSSGILSAMTTGYWGQVSDRVGRTKIMALVETGLALNEICFILVATFPYLAPGGYRALLIGPMIEGLLGGMSTITATINAYMSDVTPDGSRAAVFARLTGIMMLGFASGPVLGSLLIRATDNIMAPFYLSVAIHVSFILMILFVLPESLSSESRQILSKNAELARAAAKRQDAIDREWEATPRQRGDPNERDPLLHNDSTFSRVSGTDATHSRRRKRLVGNVRRVFRRLFAFLQPLTVFAPRETEDGTTDWNLTKVGLGMFLMGCLYGVFPAKAQFAMYNYGWTSAQLGPFMSLAGFARGVVLLVLVPLVLRAVKPYFYEPLPVSAETESSEIPAPKVKRARPVSLDLWTIRASMTLEIIPYIGLALNPNETGFIILSTLATFGSASNPTANSLALSLLPSSSEAGRLFGGLAVLHALGSTIISPLLYGTVFAATVGTYAPTIFIIAAGMLGAAWILFALVRLEKKPDDVERGRSRRVKTVRSSSGVSPGQSGQVDVAGRRKKVNGSQ